MSVDDGSAASSASHPARGILAARRAPGSLVRSQLAGSGSGVMVVVDITWLVIAPSGPVVVLVALDSSGLEWMTTRW